MLEPTKKRSTDQITLLFEGPKKNQREAIIVLKALGFMNTVKDSASVPWREAFPEFTLNEPGICLVGARHKKGLTQDALYGLTGIPRRHISEMENGKRPIGKKTANNLAAILDVDYRVFL